MNNNNNNNNNNNSVLYDVVYNTTRNILKEIDLYKILIEIKNNLDKELKNE